jgi:hypothetical protein
MANHDLGRRAGATCASSFAEFDVLIARHSAQENWNFRGTSDTLRKPRFPGSRVNSL